MRQCDEVMQTQLGNAGTWFEESLSYRSLQGDKKGEKESVKVTTETLDLMETGIQEWGSCFGDPTKWDHWLISVADQSRETLESKWPVARVAPHVCPIDPFIQRQLLSGLSVTPDAISTGSNEVVKVSSPAARQTLQQEPT